MTGDIRLAYDGHPANRAHHQTKTKGKPERVTLHLIRSRRSSHGHWGAHPATTTCCSAVLARATKERITGSRTQ